MGAIVEGLAVEAFGGWANSGWGPRFVGQSPDIGHASFWAMPADDRLGIGSLQEGLEGLGGEAPVVGWVGVDMEVEGAGNKERATGLENAGDFGKAEPEPFDMLEGAESQNGAESVVGKWKSLDIGHLIDTFSGPEIDTQVVFIIENASQVDHVFAIDLQGAHFEYGFWQVENLSGGLNYAAQQLIHGQPFVGMFDWEIWLFQIEVEGRVSAGLDLAV